MRTIGTVVSVILALLWSALVWGGYAIVAMSTAFVARSAGDVGLPSDVTDLATLVDGLLQHYGTGAAAVLWALGLLAILALRALFNLLTGAGKRNAVETPQQQQTAPRLPQQPETRPATRPPVSAQPPATVDPLPAPPAPGPARWGRDAAR